MVPSTLPRWLAAFLGALIISVALSACGDSPAPALTSTSVPTDTPAPTPPPAPTTAPVAASTHTVAPTNTPTATHTPLPTPTTAPVATPTHTAVPTNTPTPTPEPDRAALIALYNATDGPNWTNNANWLSDRSLWEWHGVDTDDQGRVTALDLSENGLSGPIPPQLGNLSDLRSLNLNQNQLTEELPSALGNLSSLEWVEIRTNRLTGAIPPELGNLTNLRALKLFENQLSGPVPPELGSLANLELLLLYDNRLTGEIPPELGTLDSLEQLALDNNQLSGPIPPELGSLTNLGVLKLFENQLSGSIPPELGSLSNLEYLALENNQLSGAIPSQLGSLANLQWLSLYANRLSGAIPPELGNLANLQWLILGGNQLTGCVADALRGVQENDLDDLGLPDCGSSTPTLAGTPIPTPTTVAPSPASERLSLDEYLSQCAVLVENEVAMEEGDTYGDLSASLAAPLEALSPLAPPEEVADWHNKTLEVLQAVKTAADSWPADSVIGSEVFFLFFAAVGLQEEIIEIQNELPSEIRRRMAEAGCIVSAGASEFDEPETLLGTLPAGESARVGDYEVKVTGVYMADEDDLSVEVEVHNISDNSVPEPDCFTHMSLEDQIGVRHGPTTCSWSGDFGEDTISPGRTVNYRVVYEDLPGDATGFTWLFSDGATGVAFDLSSIPFPR